jgi:hypothetical protein
VRVTDAPATNQGNANRAAHGESRRRRSPSSR